MASSSGAVIDWYAAASDGTPLVSGNNTYTTPSIDASTTYYAQARIVATGCVSSVRTAVLATINTVPDAPAMGGGGSQCGGTMSITATAGSNGTGIRWTDGNSTISPRSVGSGTYYAVTTSSAGCESGAASVAVTIHVVPTIARSGGAASQSVNQNSAISAITYTASNATSIVRGGSLPAGVTGSISGTTLTIRGTPSATGTFGYTVSGSHTNGCVSTISTGTITVAAAASNFYSTNTWSYGGLTWSDRVVASPSNCSKVTSLTTSNNTTADYKVDKSTGVDRYYYSWTCATGGTSGNTNAQLCPTGWRLPTRSDYSTLVSNTGYGTLISQWGYGGTAEGGTMYDQTSEAYYWASTAYTNSENYAYHLYYYSGGSSVLGTIKQLGLQVRCVK
jgi:hypothetical protein